MIAFRGADITTAAPDIKIEDIHVSPLQLNATARQRPILPGADYVRMRIGTRTIRVNFSVLNDDRDARQVQLSSLVRWARSEGPEALALPYRDGKIIYAVCTGLPEPSARQWWENKLSLVWTAYDPFFYSPAKACACGSPFTVLGDAVPKVWITRTLAAAASNQSYSDGTHTMTFSTIPAGDLVVDLNHQTASVGGLSIMQYWPLTGAEFIPPVTGAQTITGTGTVHWQEAWQE